MGGFRGGNNDFKTKIKTAGLQKPTVYYGWGIGIRTPTNRVRVCRATVTQFPKIDNTIIISPFSKKSSFL